MLAYFQLMGIEPLDQELQALKKLDSIAIRHSIDNIKKKNKQSNAKK